MTTQSQGIDLAAFGVSRERGFVPAEDPLDRLPAAFKPWDDAIADLPALIMNFQVRRRIAEIPELGINGLSTGGESERAMVTLSSLTMAHVWAGETPDFTLPRNIAVPFVDVAKRLGRPPIVQHASLVLNNWRRMDKTRPVELGNLDTQATFSEASTKSGSISQRSVSSLPEPRRSARSPKRRTARATAAIRTSKRRLPQ